jgi:hypothetical protein
VDDEFRLLVEVDADGALEAAAKEIVDELGEEIGLHRADGGLMAYADTPEEARAAERRLRQELEKRGLAQLEPRIEHWSHDDQEWQDGDGNPAEPAEDEDYDDTGSGDEGEDDDTGEETTDTGPRTVVVSLSHRHEAKQLAEELRNEGWHASSSWHHVEISTRSPEEAESLAAELEVRAPDAEVFISV